MRRMTSALVRPAVFSPIVAALVATIAALVSLDMIGMRWEVPLVYSGDAIAAAAHFKTVMDTGWYEHQPALGAPYGQVYFDYPTADNLHFVVAFLLGLIWPDWGVVMNVHFLLGFGLAAAAAAWFLGRIGLRWPLVIALSVTFAIAPYHFTRGEGHLFLSWYWVVPLGLALVLDILGGRDLWGARVGARRGLGHLTGRSGRTVGILALVASASAYYAIFTLLLGGVAALAAVLVARNGRRALGAIAAAAVTIGVMLANMAPDILYRLAQGVNPGALQRTPVESEIYGLKLSQLLLPAPYHRFGPFRELRRLYDAHYPLPSEYPALGLLAALGLVILVGAGLYAVAVAARGVAMPTLVVSLAPLAFLAIVAFLFSTVGGLSTLVSFATASIRGWNRISIVIAALALAGLGLVLQTAVERVTRSRRLLPAVGTAVAAAVVLGIGAWDQLPPDDSASRAAVVASYDSDADFGQRLETELGPGALVFELPYIAFPESPPSGDALDSDQLRLFLHSDLHVSGGGIRGREDIDSLGAIAALPTDEFITEAEALGFSGVVIDTFAEEGIAPLDAMRAAIDGGEITSLDGRFFFFRF